MRKLSKRSQKEESFFSRVRGKVGGWFAGGKKERVEVPSRRRRQGERPEIVAGNAVGSIRGVEYRLVRGREDFEEVLREMERAEEVFLDTEADNMFHYETKICLVQLMVNGRIFLVDTLAEGLELGRLWSLLEKKPLVMHGCDYDLRLLHDVCEFTPLGVFDTMLAGQLLNREKVGLASLIEEHFGVAVDKGSQRADWSRRPFSQKLLDYAAGDVFWLPKLRDLLMGELKAKGRVLWMEQQCKKQMLAAKSGFPKEDENAWRLGGAELLRGRGLGVLFEVWHWRERWAKRLDVPPFKVCGNQLLMRMANEAEEGVEAPRILERVNLGKRAGKLMPSLEEAVRKGFGVEVGKLPRRRFVRSEPLTAEEVELLEKIRVKRDAEAEKLGVPPTLIASRSQMAQVARCPEKLREVLLPWQAELLEEKAEG